jgi:hypothetical protein
VWDPDRDIHGWDFLLVFMNAETNGVEEETKDGRACCSPPKAFSSSSFRSNSRQSLLTNCGNRFRPFLDRDVWKGKAPLLLRKNKKSARPLNVAIFIKRLTPRRTSPTTTNKLCQPRSPFFFNVRDPTSTVAII